MSNPARELVKLLDAWKEVPPSRSLYSSRDMSESDTDGWRRQTRAASLVRDVEAVIDGMERAGVDVAHYRRTVTFWARGVFAPNLDWNQSTSGVRRVVTQSHIDILSGLADVIDSRGLGVVMDSSVKADVGAGLDDLLKFLEEDSLGLTRPVQTYVFELVTSVRKLLAEVSVFGDVDLLAKIHELYGFLFRLSDWVETEQGDGPRKSERIRDLARRIMPYVNNAFRVGVGALTVAAEIKELTQ